MRLLTLTTALVLAAGVAAAETVLPADVTYGEYGEVTVSLSGKAGDPAEGAAIMASKKRGNCISCHAVTALNDSPFHGEVGPILDGIGSNRSEAEIRGIVADAKMTFDESMMPSFYKTTGYIRPGAAYTGKAPTEELTPLLSAQDIEDVVAFLLTLKDS
ncbi:MAG: sulfur oxidation c-type cytochrome SoxX [Pelagimonas sp.]|uniref:sulfur oxidation c-type cytochrome SoxX n=1 Tax=Pelagimonas sp. TaxID=2073170 RepID=UPI003D6B46D5